MARSKWGFQYVSGYRPPTLSYPPKTDKQLSAMATAYHSWLAKARGWTVKKAKEYTETQEKCGLLASDLQNSKNICEIQWISQRVCIKIVRTHWTKLHYGAFFPRGNESPDDYAVCARWRREYKSDAPTVYTVLADGRYVDAFLSKSLAKQCAKPIAERLFSEDMQREPIAA